MNKVLGFAPDADPTTPGLLLDCENLLPSELGMRPGPAVAPVGVAALTEDVRGALAAIDLSGNRLAICGTTQRLYSLAGSAWACAWPQAGRLHRSRARPRPRFWPA